MEAIALSSMPKDSMGSDSESDREQSIISDKEIGDPNGTSSTINQEEDMAIISNANERSLPQINIHDSSEMDTSKWNPHHLASSPGSLIKTARELVPPPLPPPRHLVDIADGGHDGPENAWKWGNSEMYSGDLAKPTLSIPPGSSFYGESAAQTEDKNTTQGTYDASQPEAITTTSSERIRVRKWKQNLTRAGGQLSCSGCMHAPFEDAASLRRHIDSAHRRPFVCVFHFAGCESTFASKNEWKRHVSSHHLNLTAWVCELGSCGAGSKSTSRCSEFNRKDIFTQHLRRMHVPSSVKQKKSGADAAWEERHKTLQQTCFVVKR